MDFKDSVLHFNLSVSILICELVESARVVSAGMAAICLSCIVLLGGDALLATTNFLIRLASSRVASFPAQQPIRTMTRAACLVSPLEYLPSL